jgi:competence protein ComEC
MASNPQISVDVVKVPHHGSRYQHPEFPSWSHGRIALVSVGAGNDYGHPAQETLDGWTASGAIIGRTDLDGDLAVVQVPGDGDGDSDGDGDGDGDGSLGLVTR